MPLSSVFSRRFSEVAAVGVVLLMVQGCLCARRPAPFGVLPDEVEARAPESGGSGSGRVVLALVRERGACEAFFRAAREHVAVCDHGGPGGGARMRAVLKNVKEAKVLRVQRPLAIYAQAARAEEGMQLGLEEPSFFAGLVLERPGQATTSAVRVEQFGAKGGQRLALLSADDQEVERVRLLGHRAKLAVGGFSGPDVGPALVFALGAPGATPSPH